MTVGTRGRSLSQRQLEACQRVNACARGSGAELESAGFLWCAFGQPLRSQSCGFHEARQRAAASSQWAGGRGRLQRREPRPPLPLGPHPPPAPRAHLRGSHKGSGLQRTVAQTKEGANQLPSSSSQLQGSELLSCLSVSQTALLSTRAIQNTLHSKWRGPQTTRVHTYIDGRINPSTYMRTLKYFFSDHPQHFTRMHTHRLTSSYLCRWPQHHPSPQTKVHPLHTLLLSHTDPRAEGTSTHMSSPGLATCTHTPMGAAMKDTKNYSGALWPPALCRWTPQDLADGPDWNELSS